MVEKVLASNFQTMNQHHIQILSKWISHDTSKASGFDWTPNQGFLTRDSLRVHLTDLRPLWELFLFCSAYYTHKNYKNSLQKDTFLKTPKFFSILPSFKQDNALHTKLGAQLCIPTSVIVDLASYLSYLFILESKRYCQIVLLFQKSVCLFQPKTRKKA